MSSASNTLCSKMSSLAGKFNCESLFAFIPSWFRDFCWCCRRLLLAEFSVVYKRLNIANLVDRGESFYQEMMSDTVQELEQKGLDLSHDVRSWEFITFIFFWHVLVKMLFWNVILANVDEVSFDHFVTYSAFKLKISLNFSWKRVWNDKCILTRTTHK